LWGHSSTGFGTGSSSKYPQDYPFQFQCRKTGQKERRRKRAALQLVRDRGFRFGKAMLFCWPLPPGDTAETIRSDTPRHRLRRDDGECRAAILLIYNR